MWLQTRRMKLTDHRNNKRHSGQGLQHSDRIVCVPATPQAAFARRRRRRSTRARNEGEGPGRKGGGAGTHRHGLYVARAPSAHAAQAATVTPPASKYPLAIFSRVPSSWLACMTRMRGAVRDRCLLHRAFRFDRGSEETTKPGQPGYAPGPIRLQDCRCTAVKPSATCTTAISTTRAESLHCGLDIAIKDFFLPRPDLYQGNTGLRPMPPQC